MQGRSRSLLLPAASLVALGTLAACPPVPSGYAPLPDADLAIYEAVVQPIVRAECAAGGCHGSLERRLTLYAVDHLRAEPATIGTPLDEGALSDEELAWNFDAMRMRLVGETSADDAVLLLKCLDPAVGGIRHGTDDEVIVFDDAEDPDFVALRDWIEDAL